jgi:hypothetical protein
MLTQGIRSALRESLRTIGKKLSENDSRQAGIE